jgi:hypothetical protein
MTPTLFPDSSAVAVAWLLAAGAATVIVGWVRYAEPSRDRVKEATVPADKTAVAVAVTAGVGALSDNSGAVGEPNPPSAKVIELTTRVVELAAAVAVATFISLFAGAVIVTMGGEV